MTKRFAIKAIAFLVACCGGALLATDQPGCFTKLGNDRVLLMNNDQNAICPISGQGYNDTFAFSLPDGATFWTHDGDHAPMDSSYTDIKKLVNLKNGNHHVLWEKVTAPDASVVSNKLWELVDCRAGSPVAEASSAKAPRNWISWTTTAVDIDSANTIRASDYTKAGMISMQNTASAAVYSPLYSDGIGTIYFDAVNGWPTVIGDLAVDIATNTVDGSEFTREVVNCAWKTISCDVLYVAGPAARKAAFVKEKGVSSIKLASRATATVPASGIATAEGGTGGTFFYRVRANVDYRGPIRFRIRRVSPVAGPADSATYLIMDNILVSPPPVEAEFVQYGKGYDESRSKQRILGWEGAFTRYFAFVGNDDMSPWMKYAGKTSSYYNGVPADWTLSDVKFHYRWTYLGIDSSEWKTLDMVKDGIRYLAKNNASVDLSEGVGDIEYYYTASIDKAPHYDPVDYACGSVVTNSLVIGDKTCKMPYGADWREGGKPWTMTCRRSPAEGKLPSGGTDWFVRIREGNTFYEDLAVQVTEASDGVTSVSNVWMELVGDHNWRAYYYMPTNMAGKTVKFRFAGFNVQKERSETFQVNTNYWRLPVEKIGYLPYSGAADGKFDAEVRLDTSSTHLLFEFDDATGAFAISHAAYQDFNLWTDSAKGYMGYYSTTAAVSEAKKTFLEDLDSWKTSSAASDAWNEDFDVIGDISTNSPYFPGVEFGTGHRTPHNWTADNGLYTCQVYTNSDQGLSLQMEGCGRGSVSLLNLPASDVPSGIGQVEFSARIAQPHLFEDFAYSEDGLKASNYAFTVKADMSTMRGADMSKSDPSVSIVGYYRPYTGCYEMRARRVADKMIELSIWKWQQTGNMLKSKELVTRRMGVTGGNIWSSHMMVNESTDYNYSYWHTMALSMCNTPTGTVVQAKLARYQSRFDYRWDRPNKENSGNYNDQLYLIATYVDKDAPLTRGTYGMGTVNCTGYIGYPQLHLIDDASKNPTNYPFAGTLLKQEFDDDDWLLPPGRYRKLVNKNEYGKNEIANFSDSVNGSSRSYTGGWACGLAALLPEQCIEVQTATAGSADGNEWITVDRLPVTNFLSTSYLSMPQVTPNSYIRLKTGGASHDARVDVAVDDISLGSWRARDYPDISENYCQRDKWIYQNCWIESAVGVEGAYAVEAVPGTNEYCYIFTNAGKTVSFTPREDMYLSQALIVGGGGAGGWGAGGGGGGGGVYAITNPILLKAGLPVSITVGEGGNNYFSSQTGSAYIQRGDCGGASSLFVDGKDYVAYGGGGGGSYSSSAGYGCNNFGQILATGGGRSGNANDQPTAGPSATGATYAKGKPYGLGGGGNSGNGQLYVAGGGGGAGGNGVNGVTNNLEWLDSTHVIMDLIPGDGGPGWPSDITGRMQYYGGGGGGGDGYLYSGAHYTVGGVQYYGYYSTSSPWNSKYWMVRGSDYTTHNYGNRAPGKGGVGGGGDGAAINTQSPYHGGDGANGYGGGGGGGSSLYNTMFRPGGRGGDGAVILRIASVAKHQCVIQPARVPSGLVCGVRSPYLANGMSLVNFSYVGADTNCVLLLQVCTNISSAAEIYRKTMNNEDWVTLERYTFSDVDRTNGTKACYVNMRAPVQGLIRLVADPDVIVAAANQTDPNYGAISITRLLCYDEPELDARSWTGWNMWTTGWDGEKPNEFAYLYDGMYGYSCSLNYSAIRPDNRTGITGSNDGNDLAEPDKAEGDNEYAMSYPYVQGPAMTNGIGYVKFRARKMSPDQAAPSVVTVFGLTEPDDASTAVELTNIVVDARRWTQYSWRETVAGSAYRAVRLAVKGAQGTGGRNFPEPKYYMDGTEIGQLQRVLIDEVCFSEPIEPRLALIEARPFRQPLTDKVVVTDICEVAQQPLCRESFGFQVRLQPQQLADDIDLRSIRVRLAYYVGTSPWGWKNWTNEPSVVWSELQRVGNDLVWRSTYDNAPSIVSGQSAPNTVVQYFLQSIYHDNAGNEHTHEIDAVDWDGGPSWYWPVDLNERYGGNSPDRFSPYTILDTISPKRAWINEVNYYDGYDSSLTPSWKAEQKQFVELAVPAGADLTGWYLRVRSTMSDANPVLCTLGYEGIAASTVANMVNHYSFFTIVSPATFVNGTYGTAPSGQWSSSQLLSDIGISSGTLAGNMPYALELLRPSGIVEHQIVFDGMVSTGAWAWRDTGTNLCNTLRAADTSGRSTWFYAGNDRGDDSLSVFRSHGEDETCWTNGLACTPAKVNVGQTIDPEWYIAPSDEFVWVYATVLGGHMKVFDGRDDVDAAVFMVGKGGSTNITFKLDPWYEVASVTRDEVEVPGAAGTRKSYTLPLGNVSETMDIVASARMNSDIVAGIDPDDPYYNAVTHWLTTKFGEDDGDGAIHYSKFIGLSGTVTNTMSLKQMYWLDIPPTEDGWIFRAGMGGGPVDASLPISQPCEPVEVNDGYGVYTNVRVSVFLQLTNSVTGTAYPPDHLLGIEPGSSSLDPVCANNWTSATFKVTGALQNGSANDTFIGLRWFVFGPDSFGAPGTPDEFTAKIEITDPFTKASPAYIEGWSDYPGTPVFYRWALDEEGHPRSVEMLKQDSTY